MTEWNETDMLLPAIPVKHKVSQISEETVNLFIPTICMLWEIKFSHTRDINAIH
jgi:hypothetical protein